MASPLPHVARTTSRKGGRLVPANTLSELSVTLQSLRSGASSGTPRRTGLAGRGRLALLQVSWLCSHTKPAWL